MSTIARFWNSPKPTSRNELNLTSVAISVRGPGHRANEDHCCTSDKDGIFMIADGMGGHDGGAIASEFACRATFGELLETPRSLEFDAKSSKTAIRHAVSVAIRGMKHLSSECPQLSRMGTTLVIGWFIDRDLYYANVGNSRLYLYRGRRLKRLTTDHSLVEELYECGVITERQRKTHPWRHRITRYVGPSSKDTRIDFGEMKIQPGDRFLFITDGISNVLNDRSMERAARSAKSADELGSWLIAASKAAKSTDDLSCIVVDCR